MLTGDCACSITPLLNAAHLGAPSQGVPVKRGTHTLMVGSVGATVVFDPFSGMFFGAYKIAPKKIAVFNSRDGHYDRCNWMKQLRAFFHEEV